MSVSGKRGVGIPVILLHDAEGGIVTVEMKNGSVYRGLLEEAQDNMNMTMRVSCSIFISSFPLKIMIVNETCRIA